MLLGGVFAAITDHRKARGKRYELQPLLCALLLAVLSGATSFRKMECFLENRLDQLNALFGTQWKKAPSWVGIRKFLLSLCVDELEHALRAHAAQAIQAPGRHEPKALRCIAIDGKALCGSADRVQDVRARQLVSAFCQQQWIVLGHVDVADKSNEIPAVQALIAQLDLSGAVLTMDAMHCQKKPCNAPLSAGPRSWCK